MALADVNASLTQAKAQADGLAAQLSTQIAAAQAQLANLQGLVDKGNNTISQLQDQLDKVTALQTQITQAMNAAQ